MSSETSSTTPTNATVSSSHRRHQPDLWKAVGWMMVSVLAFTATAIAGRSCREHLSPMNMVFYRNFISLIILLVAFRWLGITLSSLTSVQPWMQWGRALLHFCGQWTWMTALLLIPLIELMAIEFTFPLLVALLAPLLLGEQMTRTRILGAMLGFAGTLVILFSPYFFRATGVAAPSFNAGTFFAMACAVFFAFNMIGTRYLMRRDGPLTLLMFMTVNHTILSFVLGFSTLKWLPANIVPWVIVLGVASLIAHFAIARALLYADAVVCAPLDFVRVPLMVMAGVLLYNEPVQAVALLGTLLVIGGNGVNIWGEHKAKQARSSAA